MKFAIITKTIIFYATLVTSFFVVNLSLAQTAPVKLDDQSRIEMEAQTKENSLQIRHMESQLEDLKDNYRILYDGAKNQNDQLGNQISFASYSLGAVSILLTLIGIFLAWYINHQYNKVEKLKETVDITKKAIDDNANELYKKLKREETLRLLERLREVPEDINNICPLLLSRDLLESDFSYLKDSYLKIKSSSPKDANAEGNYIILLMQHFPYQALKDDELKADMVSNIDARGFNNMFSRDIRYFFDQVSKFLAEFGIESESNKEVIKKLFYNFFKSKYGNSTDLQNYLATKLSVYGVKIAAVTSTAKEAASEDTGYIAWIDLIFI